MNRHRRKEGWSVCILALLSGALLISGAASDGEDPADEGPPRQPVQDFHDQTACPVLAIRAGNLLVVRADGEETSVRLIGTYVPQNGPAADDARAFTTRLLSGESIYLEYDPNWPRRDRDDRAWAYVYRAPDGLFVNLELIREGYARLSGAELFAHEPLFRAYERIARRAQKGLWSPRAPQPENPPTSRPAPQATTRPATPAPDSGADVQVYVTKSGKKYHRKDCQFVKDGATALTVKAAQAQGYTPCSRCKPPQ